MELLYLYSFFIYNSSPNLFELLNLTILIILPGLKFVIIFLANVIIGIRIILLRIKTICKIEKCQKLEFDEEKLLDYDYFEKNIESNKSQEYFDRFQPVALLMHTDNINRNNNCSCDCFYFCFKCIYLLLFLVFILGFFIYFYSIGQYIVYLFVFCLLSFCISIAVSNRFLLDTLFNCWSCCYNEITHNIDNKFKPFKYIFFFVIILVNFLLVSLIFISKNVQNYEYETIDQRFGKENNILSTSKEDFTEQKLPRDFIKSPMCYTSIHHLNFIQLCSLAQAAYLSEENIQKVKSFFEKNPVFKDSNLKIINMAFLTNKDDNAILLKTDIQIINSHRNLTVFSIRGSSSSRDWLLDLEMYTPSFMLTIIKSIPLIQNDESLTSKAVKALLTLPYMYLENITLLKYYSKTIINKVDKIIKNSKNTDFIFAGHSLGGGMSKYIAFHYKKISFSVSGPGVTPLEYMSSGNKDYDNNFRKNFIDIIPDHDIVPRLEISGGTKYRVLCNNDLLACHSLDRTICMIGIMCQQEEYTKELCINMPIIGREKYNEMKKLNTGNNFCENYIIDKGNKAKCKEGKVTSEGHKCCYVHLKYYIKREINEYKCLQFNSNEVFKNKYSYEPEIEC